VCTRCASYLTNYCLCSVHLHNWQQINLYKFLQQCASSWNSTGIFNQSWLIISFFKRKKILQVHDHSKIHLTNHLYCRRCMKRRKIRGTRASCVRPFTATSQSCETTLLPSTRGVNPTPAHCAQRVSTHAPPWCDTWDGSMRDCLRSSALLVALVIFQCCRIKASYLNFPAFGNNEKKTV
jgi:hypothetical protein